MKHRTLDYYNQNAEEFSKGTVNANMTVTQDRFLALLPEKASILDFGCGTGRDTKYFLSKGFTVFAIDGSKEMCKYASVYTGIEAKHMLFHELNDVITYDGIWACASILHLPYEDLSNVFLKMATALKDNGILYTSFKYGTFEGYRGERYYTDMDEEKLSHFLEKLKLFSIVEEWVSEDVRPGRSDEKWLNILLKKI